MHRQRLGQPPVRLQRPQQPRRYGADEQPVRARGPVPAPDAEIADLVFDLHHEHALMQSILPAHLMHECGTRSGVGPLGAPAEDRQHRQCPAGGGPGARKAARVVEHPAGRTAREGFFQLPNHSNTRCSRVRRAMAIQWTRIEKLKCLATRSISPPAAAIKTVLKCRRASSGGTLFAAAAALPIRPVHGALATATDSPGTFHFVTHLGIDFAPHSARTCRTSRRGDPSSR